jgi:hypothetical protein
MFMEATAYPRLNLNLDCFAGMASVIGDVSASQAAALSPMSPGVLRLALERQAPD